MTCRWHVVDHALHHARLTLPVSWCWIVLDNVGVAADQSCLQFFRTVFRIVGLNLQVMVNKSLQLHPCDLTCLGFIVHYKLTDVVWAVCWHGFSIKFLSRLVFCQYVTLKEMPGTVNPCKNDCSWLKKYYMSRTSRTGKVPCNCLALQALFLHSASRLAVCPCFKLAQLVFSISCDTQALVQVTLHLNLPDTIIIRQSSAELICSHPLILINTSQKPENLPWAALGMILQP